MQLWMLQGFCKNKLMARRFTFHPHDVNAKGGKLSLNYALHDGTKMTEIIDFGVDFSAQYNAKKEQFDRIFGYVSLAAGVSYYKADFPSKVKTLDANISYKTAEFFSDFYYHGLGEFAARNELDLESLKSSTNFEADTSEDVPFPIDVSHKSLVMIGGGKDSIVTIEALRDHKDIVLCAVNPSQSIKDCIQASGLDAIVIKRSLDPKLFEMNKNCALNGHVPITGILSFIALAASLIHGFDSVILSNERSASEETRIYQGEAINHQYSKSIAFEKAFQTFISECFTSDISSFSFLRPLSELHIAKIFEKTNRYDSVLTSCNGAHKLLGTENKRWCLSCPKCCFSFLMLATAFDKDRLISIFGANLLDQTNLLDEFEKLCGLSGHKPWECVGEIKESAAAIYLLGQNEAWQDDVIVKTLLPQIKKAYGDMEDITKELYTPTLEHIMPDSYLEILNAHLAG